MNKLIYESPNPFDNEYQRIDNPNEEDLMRIKQGDYFSINNSNDYRSSNSENTARVDGYILNKDLIYNIRLGFVPISNIKTLYVLLGATFSRTYNNNV